MQVNADRLMSTLEHKMLLEAFSTNSTQIEEQVESIVCGQSTLDELENLLGPFERCETRGDVKLLLWQFMYTEPGLGLSDPQILTVAIDGKGCVSDFALV